MATNSSLLLIGSRGQLGSELQTILPPQYNLVALDRQQLDLTDSKAIRDAVESAQPQLIINAAAYTAVDRAESEPGLAEAVNAIAPGILAESAAQIGSPFIHVSTDYVFDGQQSRPYQETDETCPLGVYGRTKQAGEAAVQAAGGHALIVRTAWVYSARGKGNFVKTMLRLGAEHQEIRVVADQVGAPTWAQDLARAIAHLSDRLLEENPSPTLEPGIYHFTNSGVASWYDFAVAIFEEARSQGFPLKVERVRPIATEEYPTPASRPAYSVLSCAKISAVLGAPPPHWRQGLRQMLQDLKALQ